MNISTSTSITPPSFYDTGKCIQPYPSPYHKTKETIEFYYIDGPKDMFGRIILGTTQEDIENLINQLKNLNNRYS